MGYARCHLVDPDSPSVYHCVSRCVRRAFLCGFDDETGACWDHRKQWIEDRLHLLAVQFAIVVYAYAVMSNHLHLVVAVDSGFTARWGNAEVVRRWPTVFPVRARSALLLVDDNASDGADGPAQQPTVSPAQVALWSQRLGTR